VRRRLLLVVSVVLVAGAIAPAAALAQAVCDPTQTPASFRGQVPTPAEVLGFDAGEREATVSEVNRYLHAVDRASPRVITGLAARSQLGRQLRYAVIGMRANMTPARLAQIRGDARRLRDPRTSEATAERILAREPAILWIASNVHGGEESGTDASLRVLHELADRDDCAATQILESAIVVLLPTQNPDGREADTRQNAYGFDMNRDWFARTQPETDGKIELLRRYPGQLFIDDHEMGRATFFFPPNADPIYHEITDTSVDWINNLYGAAVAAEFTRQGIPFFNRDVYDLFYMGYGDTVPSTGFLAAGMTYEKANGDPIAQRAYEQYVAQWVSLTQGALNADSIVRRWREEYVRAYQQGVAGFLEPNEIVNPGNEVITQVPDRPVRHYFIRDDDPAKHAEVQALVRRLQRMDVDVYRLGAPLEVADFKPYGRAEQAATLPAGTIWVPMAQGQKHWIQAMLNEDPYTPFPYFYDVTGWSQPLLFNVRGGYSGLELAPSARRVPLRAQPRAPRIAAPKPKVGLVRLSDTTSARESSGWLRWRLDTWGLAHRDLTPADVAAGGLDGLDVLLVPNGDDEAALAELGDAGAQALRDWVDAGGRYVGWRAGTRIAAALGLTTAVLAEPTSDVPGSLIRVNVDPSSPLARGVGDEAYVHYEYDLVMTHPSPAVAYPAAGTEDFFVSGFQQGAEELGGTAAVVDERVGAGRSVVFSIEPNFRGYTVGTQKLLRNAILGADPAGGTGARPLQRAGGARVARARAAAVALRSGATGALRLTVRPAGEAAARALLDGHGASYTVARSADRVAFTIANPGELPADEHPWARTLGGELRAAAVPVVAYAVP
jgi:hypothetical protein